jgi:hypothetical protein
MLCASLATSPDSTECDSGATPAETADLAGPTGDDAVKHGIRVRSAGNHGQE